MKYWLEGTLLLVCQNCDYVIPVPVETIHCPLLSPDGAGNYDSGHELRSALGQPI